MAYSVQQIKFELISYVKEFGGDFSEWCVGRAVDAPEVLFVVNEVDPVQDVWIWKPALTSAAAELVVRWMTDRQNAKPAAGEPEGHCVFIYKKTVV